LASEERSALPAGSARVSPFRIGEIRVHPALNQVEGPAGIRRLQPRIMHVLACLASRRGDVVAREELLDTVWPDAVVCEDSLTRAISDLRRALDDDPAAPRYVETIRKGGYRLLTAVEQLPAGEAVPRTARAAGTAGERGPSRRWLVALASGILAAAGVALLVFALPSDRRDGELLLEGSPFTSLPGAEVHPALSPDGTRVAFAWRGEDGDDLDIHLQQVGSATPLQITDMPGNEYRPAWSPDGQRLAFVNYGDEPGIYSVPALGGPPRRLLAIDRAVYGLDWSPQGHQLVYSLVPDDAPGARIFLLSLETLESTPLTVPDSTYSCDFLPAFSPDGRSVAFVRAGSLNERDIHLVPTRGGPVVKLTRFQSWMDGFDWLPGGEQLVVSASPPGRPGLWRVPRRGGASTWLPTRSPGAIWPSAATENPRLVYADRAFDDDVWLARLDAADPESALAPLVRSTRRDRRACFSPDGGHVAFVSDRSGCDEVWICERDGSRPRQISELRGDDLWEPFWSPDGRRIAYSAADGRRARIVIRDVAGGRPTVVAPPNPRMTLRGWSPDGEAFHCEHLEREGWTFTRVGQDGRQLARLARAGAWLLGADAAGRIYLTRYGSPGIWRVGPGEGEAELVVPGTDCALWTCLALTPDGIYHLLKGQGRRQLCLWRFATGRSEHLLDIPCAGGSRLDVAPDGSAVLFERVVREETDLVLVRELPDS
jgi:Tol biopolymer transport system component/DNA-binding winged helix-turn-helix (wHTH) protein